MSLNVPGRLLVLVINASQSCVGFNIVIIIVFFLNCVQVVKSVIFFCIAMKHELYNLHEV